MDGQKIYIAQEKGYEINWTKVRTSTTKEKVHKINVGKLKNGSMDLINWNWKNVDQHDNLKASP